MSRFPKGQSGNPLGSSKGRRGRPPGQKPSTVVIWDLKMAARKHCPKALQRISECLDDEDKKVRLMAAQIMLERGYGRPEQHVDAEMTHNFCIAPQTMPVDQWLARKGQPVGASGDEWLEKHQQSKPAPTIDLKAEEPPDDPSKLN